MIRMLAILIILASPAVAQIRIAGIGLDGYSAQQWADMIEEGNSILAQVDGPTLINAGFIVGRKVPADPSGYRQYAAQRGVRCDVAFVLAGKSTSGWLATNVCLKEDARGCASADTRSGVILWLPREAQVGTLLHELGHIAGLGHTNNADDLMCSARVTGSRMTRQYLRMLTAFAGRKRQ